jgi:hypothetical protein
MTEQYSEVQGYLLLKYRTGQYPEVYCHPVRYHPL